jgi:hypothetical protein
MYEPAYRFYSCDARTNEDGGNNGETSTPFRNP